MARLNSNEKLIRAAARGEIDFGVQVYFKMLEFYSALKLVNSEENCDIINYLYLGEHKRETFNCIALKLGLSLSKLESKRKEYQKVFFYYYEKMKTEKAA